MKKIKLMMSILLLQLIILSSTAQKTTNIQVENLLSKLENNDKSVFTDFKENATKTIVGTDKEKPIGEYNWTKDYIDAEGVCYLNKDHIATLGLEYAIDLAKAGADADARANLLGMILNVRIFDTVRVVDKMLEKKITVQVLDGTIKARKVGDYVVTDKYVRVKMRTDIISNSNGSVSNFINENNLIEPPKEDKIELEKLRLQVLSEMKKAGLADDTATQIPAMIVQLPKEQAKNFNPSIIPTITIQNPDGSIENIDLSKYFNIKDGKAIQIINASRDILAQSGLFDKIPVLGGETGLLNSNNININLKKNCMIEGMTPEQIKKCERNNKIKEIFAKIGNTLLKVVPLVAMFI